MTSSNADHGLLAPVHAGTPVAAVTSDAAVVRAMLSAEAALARALADTGVVGDGVASVIERACGTGSGAGSDTGLDTADLARRAVAGGNPAIPLVDVLRSRVAEGHAEAARWVHHGATSQDIVDTALVLVTRDALRLLVVDLRRAAGSIARLVDTHRDTPAVARTLTQQALPTSFGARAAGWLVAVTDAVRAVTTQLDNLPAQLGGPVGITGAYGVRGPAVLDAYARELGLVAPVTPWHTRRTPVLDIVHTLQVASSALGGISADVLVLARTEVGEVRDTAGGPSSAMAHKRNPTRAVLVAGAVRQTVALLGVLGSSASAEDERPAGAWHAEWQPWRECLRLVGGAATRTADLLDDLEVDTEAVARNLRGLTDRLGLSAADVAASMAAAGPWVDRALGYARDVAEGTGSDRPGSAG